MSISISWICIFYVFISIILFCAASYFSINVKFCKWLIKGKKILGPHKKFHEGWACWAPAGALNSREVPCVWIWMGRKQHIMIHREVHRWVVNSLLSISYAVNVERKKHVDGPHLIFIRVFFIMSTAKKAISSHGYFIFSHSDVEILVCACRRLKTGINLSFLH